MAEKLEERIEMEYVLELRREEKINYNGRKEVKYFADLRWVLPREDQPSCTFAAPEEVHMNKIPNITVEIPEPLYQQLEARHPGNGMAFSKVTIDLFARFWSYESKPKERTPLN